MRLAVVANTGFILRIYHEDDGELAERFAATFAIDAEAKVYQLPDSIAAKTADYMTSSKIDDGFRIITMIRQTAP